MRISDNLAESLLAKSGKFTEQQISDLRSLSDKTHKPLQDLIVSGGLMSEAELTRLYAEELGVPFVELSSSNIDPKVVTNLPHHIANHYGVVVFNVDSDGNVLIAMEDPSDTEAIRFLEKQLGNNLKLHLTSSSLLKAALEEYYEVGSKHNLNISNYGNQVETSQAVHDISVEASNIAESLNHILNRALSLGASDIHIEPQTDHGVIRYRVDGLLREAYKLPHAAIDPLIGYIKTTSQVGGLDHFAPQYGQWVVEMGDQRYTVRVSVITTIDGEKALLHITHESSKAPSLRNLGLWGTALHDLQTAVTEPNGTLLVVGPIKSGKSTTLFSLLNALSSPSVNIVTIEDPVEYRVRGANQFQVSEASGISFTTALKAILNQDPNVIMLSEINDAKLCDMAIQASLKGHLILSSLHTPSAAAGLHRLLEMGVEPYMVASSMRAIVGQRLPRRLCPNCREIITPNKTMLEQIEKFVHLKNHGGYKRLHQLESAAREEGVGATDSRVAITSQLGSTTRSINRLWAAHEGGCENCNHTGYRGRIGIFEVLRPGSEIQKAINNKSGLYTINQAAVNSGMVSMQLDGLIKALLGQTTISEVLRVTAHG